MDTFIYGYLLLLIIVIILNIITNFLKIKTEKLVKNKKIDTEKTKETKSEITLKDIGFFILFGILVGALTTLLFMVITNLFTNRLHLKNISGADAISIANTYIVLVTLLFVIWTIVITIYTIWFSKWFSREQIKEIKDNLRLISKRLSNDKEIREWFIIEIIKEEKFSKEFEDKISQLLDKILQEKVKDKMKDVQLVFKGER